MLADERRQNIRWQVNHPIKTKFGTEGVFYKGIMNDINFKGLKITLENRLSEEEPLNLSLAVCEGFVLNVEAKIAWHKTVDESNIYGLRFTRIRDIDKERIYHFLCCDYCGELSKRWWENSA